MPLRGAGDAWRAHHVNHELQLPALYSEALPKRARCRLTAKSGHWRKSGLDDNWSLARDILTTPFSNSLSLEDARRSIRDFGPADGMRLGR